MHLSWATAGMLGPIYHDRTDCLSVASLLAATAVSEFVTCELGKGDTNVARHRSISTMGDAGKITSAVKSLTGCSKTDRRPRSMPLRASG